MESHKVVNICIIFAVAVVRPGSLIQVFGNFLIQINSCATFGI